MRRIALKLAVYCLLTTTRSRTYRKIITEISKIITTHCRKLLRVVIILLVHPERPSIWVCLTASKCHAGYR